MVFCEKSLFAPRPMAAGTSSPTFSKFSNFLALLVTAFYYSFTTLLQLFTKFLLLFTRRAFFSSSRHAHYPTTPLITTTTTTVPPQRQIQGNHNHKFTSLRPPLPNAEQLEIKISITFYLRYMFTTFYYVFDKVQEHSRKFIEQFQSVQIAIPGIKATSRENHGENIEK